MGFTPVKVIGLSRRLNLDVIRLMALLLVVFHHSTQPVSGWLQAHWTGKISLFLGHGWIGVDLFFVLSGYLLSSQLVSISESVSRTGASLNFYLRRILRTWPGYYLLLLLILFVLPFRLHSSGATYVSDFSVANWFFAGNFHLPTMAFDAAWSLCLEEQFYLLIPLIYAFLRGRRERSLLFVVIVIAAFVARAISYHWRQDLIPGNYPQYWEYQMNLFFHPESFIAGLALGEYHRELHRFSKFKKWGWPLFFLVSAVLFFWGWNAIGFFSVFFLLPFLALSFAALIWWSEYWDLSRAPLRLIQFFSERTYSIYLTHTITNELLKAPLAHVPVFAAWLLGLTVAIGGGCIFYEVAERPFLSLRRKVRPRTGK